MSTAPQQRVAKQHAGRVTAHMQEWRACTQCRIAKDATHKVFFRGRVR